MVIPNYSKVRLLTNEYLLEGVCIGSEGYIIEIYPNGKYEVEFSDIDGITIALIVLDTAQFELVS